jgi:hypothetical protein
MNTGRASGAGKESPCPDGKEEAGRTKRNEKKGQSPKR